MVFMGFINQVIPRGHHPVGIDAFLDHSHAHFVMAGYRSVTMSDAWVALVAADISHGNWDLYLIKVPIVH